MFEDFCNVKQEKFDPSRVSNHIVLDAVHNIILYQISELYDTIKYCALHHRTFLFSIFSEHEEGEDPPFPRPKPGDRRLHELYGRAKALFDLVAPQEYGIDPAEKCVFSYC